MLMTPYRQLKNFSIVVSLGLFLTCISSCKTNSKSTVKDLAYNSENGTRNVLAIFTAPNPVGNTPVGMVNDASDVIAGITGLDQGFDVYKNEAATSAIVEGWIQDLVDDKHMSEDGTLFVYIAGHGAPSAQAQMNDGTFVGYDQIARSIVAGRKGKPLKRLIVMIFGCFSGSWIDVVRNYDNSKVAEQVYTLTSSTAGQYSMFNGTNTQLVDAFRTVLNSYKENPSGVTIGQFFQGIQQNVPGSTPQYYVSQQNLLNETLFSKKVLALHNKAQEQGIMPSVNDFKARKFSPNKTTITNKLDLEFNPEVHCKFDILENADKQQICSAWNRKDTQRVFTYTLARSNGPSRCDLQLLMSVMNAESYEKFYEHCGGILRSRASLAK